MANKSEYNGYGNVPPSVFYKGRRSQRPKPCKSFDKTHVTQAKLDRQNRAGKRKPK